MSTSTKIAIVDYRAGNLTSVKLAVEAIGAQGVVTSSPDEIRAASHIIFPGVGAAGSAMQHLAALNLADVLRERIAAGIPFLGICLGTQILLAHSEEDGGVDTLGILPGNVKRFPPVDHTQNPFTKIPHMGWNNARIARPHPLLAGIPDESFFYFVHSYYPAPSEPSDIICTTDYDGITFASMIGRGNVVATQFHVEKSGKTGLAVLKNFAAWNGEA